MTPRSHVSKFDHLMGKALKAHLRGDHKTALTKYRQLGLKNPKHCRPPYFAGLSVYALGDLDMAIAFMQHAVKLDPTQADSHYNLGKFYQDRGMEPEAMDSFLNAIERNPEFPEALNNLGNLYLNHGDFETAEQCYTKALAVRTTSPDALYNRSFLKLLKGDMRGGFADYEARWSTPGYLMEYRREFMTKRPRWVGNDLNGRRLFVVSEQGFGDTLQFIRYIPHLVQWVGPIHLEVQRALFDLIQHNLPEGVTLSARGDPEPECDVWCSLMSLPAIFQGMMPPTPTGYIKPDTVEHNTTGKRRIGICWAGSTGHKNDYNRSARFVDMLPFASVPNAEFYSLQIGDREAEAAGAAWLTLAGDKWKTFGASARFIAGLDLVITCDSAPAHLAGALGVPCWVMIPKVPDFRWQLERTDSPWYPTLRLYRQSVARQWGDVVERMVQDLKGET